MRKYILAKTAELAMIANATVAIFPSAHVWSIGWRTIIISLALIAAACSIIHGYYLGREDRDREKREQARDKRFEELVSQLKKRRRIMWKDSAPKNGLMGFMLRPNAYESRPRPSLSDRIEDIAREMFAFLREKGMQPSSPPLEHGLTIEEEVRRLWPGISTWTNAIYYGYERRFKQRLRDLLSELRENNIHTEISHEDIEPPHGQSADSIRALAEKLLMLAVKMDAEATLGGN